MAQFDMTGWKRVEDDDPRRCQANNHQGQCKMISVEESKYCPVHGGAKKQAKLKKQSFRNYQSELYRRRLDRFADSDGLKSLRDEIGVLRMTVEALLNACKTDADLIMKSTPLADLVMKIEKLVMSSQKMDEKLGVMMDKAEATAMISQVVDIVAKHVTEDKLDEVIEDVQALLSGGPDRVLGVQSDGSDY